MWFADVTLDTSVLPQVITVGTWSRFAIVKDSELDVNPIGEQKISDEGGNQWLISALNSEVILKGNFFRSKTKDILDMFGNPNTRDQYWAVVKEVSERKRNGVYEYLYMPICRIAGNFTLKAPGNDAPFELLALATPIDQMQTISAANLPGCSALTGSVSITVKAGSHYGYDSI